MKGKRKKELERAIELSTAEEPDAKGTDYEAKLRNAQLIPLARGHKPRNTALADQLLKAGVRGDK